MKYGENHSSNVINLFAPDHKGKVSQTDQDEKDQILFSLVELMHDGVFIAQDYKFIYANPALESMLGYQPDELYECNFETVIAKDFLELWLERYKQRTGEGPEPTSRYEIQLLRKDGSPLWFELQARRISYKGKNAVLVVLRDIGEFKKQQAELEKISSTDELTGLANRNRIMDLLDINIKTAARRNEKVAILFLDLDGFKEVNDTLGHAAGDALLQKAAKRMSERVRTIDTVGRLGGDEFVILLGKIESFDDSKYVAEKILKAISAPYTYEEKEMKVSVSIGISHYPDDGEDGETLLRKADEALYYVKKRGKHGYRIYGVAEENKFTEN